jgi:hypothetical protein
MAGLLHSRLNADMSAGGEVWFLLAPLRSVPRTHRWSATPSCHIGFILDELSSQGLELWQDERRHWRWRWLGTEVQAERGFWALGEAHVFAADARETIE